MSFNHNYPLPQSSSSSAPHYSLSPEQIKELMDLQMQRDFLEKHAKFIAKETNTLLPSIIDTSLEDGRRTPEENYQRHKHFLKNQIQAYRHYVQSSQYTPSYTQIVLLRKVGSEEAGISTNLGRHFAQLQRIPVASIPFVELSFNGGLCFYWKNREEAIQFQNALSAHQIPTIATIEQLPGYQNQYHEYKTAQTMAVKVPHRYIEALLSVAQYHPYSYEKVINDLYQGKMDRTQAILAEVEQGRTVATAKQESFVAVTQVDRLPLTQEKDLIAIEIGSCKPATVEKDTPHLVLVLDDSGSMDGEKIEALNKALRTLIHSLDDNVLVSIQTLNLPTIAQRKPAKELKEYLPVIPAPGSTPLLEAIAGSAAHFRAHPLDLVIPQAEFNRTTMVVLTDGQPNGGSGDTVNKLVTSMRESSGLAPFKHIRTRNDFPSINLSFGSEAVPCTQLPIVLGFSVGTDGDTQFMQDLAQRFSTPQGFIRTGQDIDEDMGQAVCLVQQMQGRHEKAFVGVSYTGIDGRHQASGLTMRNLFYGFSRRVFFTVPRNSPITTALIHDVNVAVGSCPFSYTQNSLLISEYVRNEFEDIKSHYAKESLKSKDPNYIPGFDEAKVIEELGIEYQKISAPSSGRRGIVPKADQIVIKKQADYENDHRAWLAQDAKLKQLEQRRENARAVFKSQNANKTPLQKLQQDSAYQIDVLMSYLPREYSALRAEMELYKSVELLNSNPQYTRSGHVSVTDDAARKAVAESSQGRHIGASMNSISFVVSKDITPILSAIECANMDSLKIVLSKAPALINAVDHKTGGTALHAVLFYMREAREQSNSIRVKQLEAIAYYLINHPEINFCQQDVRGSTAAHNAAWWGFPDILMAIIGKTKERGQLEPLLRVRNHQHVGGTTVGENLVDNVRLNLMLQDSQKQLLLRALTVNTAVCNQHTEPYWNTPLMNLLYELSIISSPEAKIQKRRAILEYIEHNKTDFRFHEASFHGNTALHFAFWNQEYTIGLAILNAAKAQGSNALQNVLAARNTVGANAYGGGEVPHMNLMAKMHLLEKEETLGAVFELFGFVNALGIQFDIGSGKKQSIPEILNQGDPIKGSIQILKSILAMNIMPAQMNEPIQKWILQLEALECFMKTQTFIATHLDDKGKAELGRLYTVYQKQIEGYCAFNFLIQAPLVQLRQDCAQLKAMQLPEALRALVAELEQITMTMHPNSMQAACEKILNWQRSNPINPNSLSSTSALHAQLTRTLIHLSQALHDQKQAHVAAVPGYVPSTKHLPPPPPLPQLSPSQSSCSSNSSFGSGYSQSSSSNLSLPQQNARFFSSGGIPVSQPPVPSYLPLSSQPPVPSRPPLTSQPPVPSQPRVPSQPPVPSHLPLSSQPPLPSRPPLPSQPRVPSYAPPLSQQPSAPSHVSSPLPIVPPQSQCGSSSLFGPSAMSPNHVDLAAQNQGVLSRFFTNNGVSVQVFLGTDEDGHNNYYVWSNDPEIVKRLPDLLMSYSIHSQSNPGSSKRACPPAQHCNAWHIILTDNDAAKLSQPPRPGY